VLGEVRLNRIVLDKYWVGLERLGLDCVVKCQIKLDRIGTDRIGLCCRML
jgi:hypothetical protein